MKIIRLALTAAFGLALLLPGMALGWTPPGLDALCAQDGNSLSWTVTLSGEEPNYDYDWSFDSDFETFTTVEGDEGANALTTPRGGETLYVRWSSDHGSKTSEAANEELCEQPEPTPNGRELGGSGICNRADTGGFLDRYLYTLHGTPGEVVDVSGSPTFGGDALGITLTVSGTGSVLLELDEVWIRYRGSEAAGVHVTASKCGTPPELTPPPTATGDVTIAGREIDGRLIAGVLAIGGLSFLFLLVGRRVRRS